MHPRPYRLESYSSPSRSSMHTPAPAHGGTTATNASSTAVEAVKTDDAVERHPPSSGTDVESQVSASGGLPQYTRENDPYGLWLGYKTDTDLADIRANTSRKRVSAQAGSKGPGSSGGGGILGSYLPLPTAALRAKRVQGLLPQPERGHREAAQERRGAPGRGAPGAGRRPGPLPDRRLRLLHRQPGAGRAADLRRRGLGLALPLHYHGRRHLRPRCPT